MYNPGLGLTPLVYTDSLLSARSLKHLSNITQITAAFHFSLFQYSRFITIIRLLTAQRIPS